MAMPIISCNLSTLLCRERLSTLKADPTAGWSRFDRSGSEVLAASRVARGHEDTGHAAAPAMQRDGEHATHGRLTLPGARRIL